MLETDKPAQDKLKQYLTPRMSGTDEDLRHAFSLEQLSNRLAAQELPVRFEAARFLW